MTKHQLKGAEVWEGDALSCLKEMAPKSVHCIVTSPPYWAQRDYEVEGQIGTEPSPWEYVDGLTDLFGDAWRVLRDDGTLWLNMGDTYVGGGNIRGGDPSKLSPLQAGSKGATGQLTGVVNTSKVQGLKRKDMIGIPWQLAIMLQDYGWYLRSAIIWNKTNCMPRPDCDRPVSSYEHIFLLTKKPKYYFNWFAGLEKSADGIGQRRSRNVWTMSTGNSPDAHFAVFPDELPRRCISMGCPQFTCNKCGAGWMPAVFTNRVSTRPGTNCKVDATGKANKDPKRHVTHYWQTNNGDGPEWKPTCKCDSRGVVPPARVLDPFAGVGTTMRVARDMGRYGIGIELSPKYIQMTKEKLA